MQVEISNKFFKNRCGASCISEKEFKYFFYNFKRATNLGKLYRLYILPGIRVISHCGTPNKKASVY